jgi:hypothetical protein
MPSLEFEFEAYCAVCNSGICSNVDGQRGSYTKKSRDPYIDVTPCEDCLEEARQEGRDEKDREIEKLEERISDLEHEINLARLNREAA